MGRIEVVQAGLMTTLQDAGRPGLAFYAIPASGPLDPTAAQAANLLVGNAPSATLLECNFVPPVLLFQQAADIGLAGGDMHWRVDDAPVRRHCTVSIAAGGVLSGQPARQGSRGYIAIAGHIDTELSFGSTACYPLAGWGGNAGRPLRRGDCILWRPAPVNWRVDMSLPSAAESRAVLEVRRGPEFDCLTGESKHRLITDAFRITADSNRMGARLDGPLLTGREALLDSVPVLPGMIQLLPSGHCIVVLQDGQATGGYPRIAFLSRTTLGRFNQLMIGEPFHLRF